jgi:hypothetical protein
MAPSSRSQRATCPTTTLIRSDLPCSVRGRPLASADVCGGCYSFSYSPVKGAVVVPTVLIPPAMDRPGDAQCRVAARRTSCIGAVVAARQVTVFALFHDVRVERFPAGLLLRQSDSRTRNPSTMSVRASSVCCAADSPGRSRTRNGSVLLETNSMAAWWSGPALTSD